MSMVFDPQPILEDEEVLLRPLAPGDFESLYEVAADPAMWEQHPSKERSLREGFANFFDDAIKSGTAFLIIDKKENKVIGTSRYNFVKEADNAVEIGWTFIARKYWGGHYNKAIKELMINYAFAYFDNILFYVHQDNFRSQKAVQKIGGKKITAFNGELLSVRPTASVIYCINKRDWNV